MDQWPNPQLAEGTGVMPNGGIQQAGEMTPLSDFIVYVDESGDHGLQTNDPNYPIFVLAFCIFEKSVYTRQITPALQEFKFKYFGHDIVILHEHEIRKTKGPFKFLFDESKRVSFMADLNQIVETANFTLIATVIRKDQFKGTSRHASNPYHIAMKFGLERIRKFLLAKKQAERQTHVVFEARGKKEDNELELEFRRVCDGDNYRRQRFSLNIVIASKQINSCGLQLADLVARPIGRKILNRQQPNRAYDILEKKFDRSPDGKFKGWGLKVYP